MVAPSDLEYQTVEWNSLPYFNRAIQIGLSGKQIDRSNTLGAAVVGILPGLGGAIRIFLQIKICLTELYKSYRHS